MSVLNLVEMDSEKVKLHEQFIQNVQGASMAEVLWITLSSHFCTLLVPFIGILFPFLSQSCNTDCVPNVCKTIKERRLLIFVKEFVFLVVPLIFLTTVMSKNVLVVVLTIAIVLFSSYILTGSVKLKKRTIMLLFQSSNSLLKKPICDMKRSFVTCCRSAVNIMTVISILAVDFNIFPRRLAKTETFGISLMDLGVGLFVLSNAAVIKINKIVNTSFKQTLLGCLVLFSLGFTRLYFVDGINYQKNVSEYGVHWNFFFTLGTIKFVSFITLKIFSTHSLMIGIVLCILHQVLLISGLEQYVVGDKPRDSWINANREGLVSILGYTSLYLIGISFNEFILKKSATIYSDLKTIVQLLTVSVLLFLITFVCSDLFRISRRLVSITYITWVLAIAFLHIAVAMLVEIFMICIMPPSKKAKFYSLLTPIILESINYNGLTFFLLANILTGLINIMINTMEMSVVSSIVILTFYMLVNCSIIFVMYFRQIQLKFW